MKNMKGFRKLLAGIIVLVMVLGIALADTYDVSQGSVTVHAKDSDQTVKHGDSDEVSDLDPVITGTTTSNTVTIIAEAGATAEVTFDGLNIDTYNSNLDTPAVKTEGDGNVAIELDGDNSLTSDEDYAGLQKSNGGTLTILRL